MSATTLTPAMRSRPVYGKLSYQPGTTHLMVADAEGAEAILDMAKAAPPDLMANGHVIYLPKKTGQKYGPQLRALNPAIYYEGPSFEAALPRIKRVLLGEHMGLQVYTAGTEGVMGQVIREVMEAGLPYKAVHTEHRGSTARRVQCVHCKGITEDVTTDPFVCSHCGLNLFVRDHYSRRIAAFQGVNIDAEDPGLVPPAVERFK